eukprot:3920050-Prymnesium_polylepis.2
MPVHSGGRAQGSRAEPMTRFGPDCTIPRLAWPPGFDCVREWPFSWNISKLQRPKLRCVRCGLARVTLTVHGKRRSSCTARSEVQSYRAVIRKAV